jgi:hypothetical protein
MIWVVNTHEDYDEVEATQLSVDKEGTLIAYSEGVVVAGWTNGFWYSFGLKAEELRLKEEEENRGQEQQEDQERQG